MQKNVIYENGELLLDAMPTASSDVIYYDNGTAITETLFLPIFTINLEPNTSYFIEGRIRAKNTTAGNDVFRVHLFSTNSITEKQYGYLGVDIENTSGNTPFQYTFTDDLINGINFNDYGGWIFTCQISGDDLPLGDTLLVNVATYTGTPTGKFVTSASFVKVTKLS